MSHEAVIRAHLDTLAHSPEQVDVALAACVEFANLAQSYSGGIACRQVRVVQAVLAALQRHGTVVSVAIACLQCLEHLDNVSSAGLQPVLSALQGHIADAEVVTRGLAIMAKACVRTPPEFGSEVLIDSGAVEAVQQVLHTHGGSTHIVAGALQLLARLSFNTPRLGRVGTADTVRALLHATFAHLGCADVAKWGVWALGNIVVDDGVEHTVRELGGVAAASAVLVRHGASIEHAEVCCLALYNLLHARQRVELFLEAGAHLLLLVVISAHRHVRETSTVLQDALNAIAALAEHADAKAALVAAGAAAKVRATMAARLLQGSWGVLTSGCWALEVLRVAADDSSSSAAPACACASVSVILDVLKAFHIAVRSKQAALEIESRLVAYAIRALSRLVQHAPVAHHAMTLGCVDVALGTLEWAVERPSFRRVMDVARLLVQLSALEQQQPRGDTSDVTCGMAALRLVEPDDATNAAARRAALTGALAVFQQLLSTKYTGGAKRDEFAAAAAQLQQNLQ